MGNTFIKNNNTNTISSLQNRLVNIEKLADIDGDGIVTKKELKDWTTKELKLYESEILLLRSERANAEDTIKKLNDELEQQKKRYNELHKKYESCLEVGSAQSPLPYENLSQNHTISNKALKKFVDDILQDPNLNIYLLPDNIEKPLYMNTLKILLSVVQKVLNNTNLDIIGHEFKLQMQPSPENIN